MRMMSNLPYPGSCLFLCAALAIGCGKVTTYADGSVDVDAADHDGTVTTVDAAPDAPTRGEVTVHVLSQQGDGLPLAGAIVLFFESDGTEAGRATTGGDGTATAEVGQGAYVTVVVLESATSARLVTVVDVAPLDEITVGRAAYGYYSAQTGTMTITVPAYGPATGYGVNGDCMYGYTPAPPAPMSSYIYEGCPTTTDAIAEAYFTGGSVYLGANNVTIGGTYNFGGSWSYPQQFTASLTHVPDEIGSINLTREVISGVNSIYQNYTYLENPPITTALTTPYPGTVGDATIIRTNFYQAGTLGVQQHINKVAGSAASFGYDLGDALIPWWTQEPVIDGPNVTWTTIGGGAPDAIVLDLGAYENVTPNRSAAWQVVLPPDRTSFTLPPLPDDLAALWLSGTGINYYTEGAMIETDFYPGYAAARVDLASQIENYRYRYQRVLSQPSGHLYLSESAVE